MSESHEAYKNYLAKKESKEKAIRRESQYVSDYEKDERIAKLEWQEKQREEEEDNRRANRLFDYTDY